MNKRPKQLVLAAPPTHGGKRKNAGRKRTLVGRDELPHRARPDFEDSRPLHVTMRVARRVYSLRSRRSLRVIERNLVGSRESFRVVKISIQGNHIHLLVEADGKRALSSGMRSLSIRLAKGMNRLMGTQGRVIDDRYHARPLRTPTEVRTVMHYLAHNRRHHVPSLPAGYVDVFVLSASTSAVLREPTLWLLRVGWRRGRVTRAAMRWGP